MTKTRAIDWGLLFAASVLTICGLAGCGREPSQAGQRVPTSPSPPQLSNPAPTILSVTPSIGSTVGGAAITITGTGLLPGIRVTFGARNAVANLGSTPGRISVTTPNHPLGSVDVMVTNLDDQNAVAIDAYTFAAPESFEVDGNWLGGSFAGDFDEPFTFTVVNGAVVSITCATSGLVWLSPPAPIIRGEFSFGGEDGIAVSGRILAPKEAKGHVNVGAGNVRPCVGAEWHAIKDQ